jgi:murein L,D-transpeptidase YafK
VTSAVLTVSVMLAGCNTDDISMANNAKANQPVPPKLIADMTAKDMDLQSPILVRLYKQEAELEIWKQDRSGRFALLKTYPICRWSGDLGPKVREGDRQAPEGFYSISPAQMNPQSAYYLSFNTGYPNAFDRSLGRTGSQLMVHGDCSSRGCYAMTDEQIQEIYALARESFFGGQKDFQLQAFPFRMTALNMAKHRNNPNLAFWKMIKEGYDNFEATHQEPKVAVCEKRYVFDAVAPENASKPLSFNPRGACPAYRLDPAIADAALDHRRQEQVQMANYIARGVDTVPFRTGIDGGTNPVFLAKLSTRSEDGRVYQLSATGMEAPGALPRTASVVPAAPVKTAEAAPTENAEPVELGSVPTPALPSKDRNAPPQTKSIAGLIGNLFSGAPAEAKPAADNATLRGRTDTKRKPAAPVHVAAAPAAPPPKLGKNAEVKPVANAAPEPPAKKEAAPQMRTAFSAPPPTNGVLPGAQPVLPTGSFDQRFSAFR